MYKPWLAGQQPKKLHFAEAKALEAREGGLGSRILRPEALKARPFAWLLSQAGPGKSLKSLPSFQDAWLFSSRIIHIYSMFLFNVCFLIDFFPRLVWQLCHLVLDQCHLISKGGWEHSWVGITTSRQNPHGYRVRVCRIRVRWWFQTLAKPLPLTPVSAGIILISPHERSSVILLKPYQGRSCQLVMSDSMRPIHAASCRASSSPHKSPTVLLFYILIPALALNHLWPCGNHSESLYALPDFWTMSRLDRLFPCP